MTDRIGCIGLAHLHVVVDDLDYAAEFYRTVLDFLEFQSHENLSNAGLARYYGWMGNPDDFRVSLRFLAWPDLLTLKLVRVRIKNDYKSPEFMQPEAAIFAPRNVYGSNGIGPISVRVKDLDATFKFLSSYAQDYSAKYRVTILSEPTYLSPLRPGEIGATKDSVLYQQKDILEKIGKAFPQRAKFQLIDPFGVRWEFNNDVI
jgi:catechol 2,3-dioxygenase-like lactoylglutathione lyase family enzyme